MPDKQEQPKKKPDAKAKKPSKKIDRKVTELEGQVEKLTEDVKRAHADFINFKRRAELDKATMAAYGKREAVTQLLPVFDTLDRALNHAPADLKDHEWVQGIESTAKQLEQQLQSIGLIRIGEEGEEFDPNHHEAVSVEEGEGEKEVIAEVLQTGYKLDETVIRPAMVKVSRR